MELVFYRVPTDIALDTLKLGAKLFFFDFDEKARYPVTSDEFKSYHELAKKNNMSYFQILVSDFSLILENDLMLSIIEENQYQFLAIERFHERKLIYEKHRQDEWGPILFLANSLRSNNFQSLAQIIQADLSRDPQTISIFASSISETIEKILRRDSTLSRTICFSYCFFKDMKYEDRSLLYDFLGALLLKDLGLSQNRANDIFLKNDIYFKHPYYALFLLKKLSFEVTEQCYYFILDHHELMNGEGFPRKKTGAFFHPLCDVLKLVEWIFYEKEKLSEYKKVISGVIERSKQGDFLNASLIASLSLLHSYLAEE